MSPGLGKAHDRTGSSSRWTGFQELTIGWFPILVVFIMMPLAVYLPNQAEFGYNATLLIPFLVAALMAIPLLMLVLHFAGGWRHRLISTLFYAGVFLALADTFAPVQLGAIGIQGSAMEPYESPWLTAIELMLLVAVIAAAVVFPVHRFSGWVSVFVVALLAVQIVHAGSRLSPNTTITLGDRVVHFRQGTVDRPSRPSHQGNVYQICFDTYSSVLFLNALKDLGLEDSFDGFTFYRNNRANYIFTLASLPSFFTGSFYPGGKFKEWDEEKLHSGMIKHLYDHGFTVSMYAHDKSYLHEKATTRRTTMDLIRRHQRSRRSLQFDGFALFWLMRVFPNAMQQEVYGFAKPRLVDLTGVRDSGKGPAVKRSTGNGAFGEKGVPLMDVLMDEESKRSHRGNYVYAHLSVTHSPIGRRDRDCRYIREGGTTYHDHVLCATRLMSDLIALLKSLGRYRESTIIFFSDHGASLAGPEDRTRKNMPDRVVQKIVGTNNFGIDYTYNRTFALLLVKPSGQAGTPLKVSDSPTMLVDIPNTLFDVLDLPVRAKEGRSVLSVSPGEQREIPFFVGFVRKEESGAVKFLGKQLFKGNLTHFSFTQGRGWKLYPDIPFVWQ